MTERKRMIELIREAFNVNGGETTVDKAADHLLANGVVVPPCKVGDKIYYLDRYSGEVEEDTVKFFTFTKNGVRPLLERHNKRFWEFYSWGKTVFLTKEEAEQALKGGAE